MATQATNNTQKKAKAVISFRFGSSVKQQLEQKALEANLDPSDIYSQVFAEGLTSMYGYEIQGKEIVN